MYGARSQEPKLRLVVCLVSLERIPLGPLHAPLMPAEAGIQFLAKDWVLASAGMSGDMNGDSIGTKCALERDDFSSSRHPALDS